MIQHTGRAPTGYTVTFRYRDPKATSVLIQGEWYFSDPSHTTMTSSQGLLPQQWKPGDVATGWPNPSADDGWPLLEMTKDSSGVWSYTASLPSGYYNYGFYVDCTLTEAESAASGVGCARAEIADPGNPPWNLHHGTSAGSDEPRSQVYVPADPAFDKVDFSWESPTSPKGALKDVTYQALFGAFAAQHGKGANFLSVYTPPGYDPHRSTPYPTLYLSPGTGLNEVDWSTQGDAANIVDNLIRRHAIAPMVVIMTNTGCFPDDACAQETQERYDRDIVSAVIPYVEAHYRVSKAPEQRAFAGFSFGGFLAGTMLVDHTSSFGSYGLFSPCPWGLAAPSTAQVAAIRKVGILVGGGLQDGPCHLYAAQDQAVLQHAAVPSRNEFFYGGHDWDVWRLLLRDFLLHVAFKPVRG